MAWLNCACAKKLAVLPPAPPPPVAGAPPVASLTVSAIQGARDVCPGDPLRLTVNATGWLPDQTPNYQWFIDGQPVAGATGTAFSVPTIRAGSRTIIFRVAVDGSSVTSPAVAVRIKPLLPPVVRFSVSPAVITYGDRITLAPEVESSECGGPARVRFTASDGSILGNVFDSSTVGTFDAGRNRQQTRTVRLTATATDQKNQTASATAELTVTLEAVAATPALPPARPVENVGGGVYRNRGSPNPNTTRAEDQEVTDLGPGAFVWNPPTLMQVGSRVTIQAKLVAFPSSDEATAQSYSQMIGQGMTNARMIRLSHVGRSMELDLELDGTGYHQADTFDLKSIQTGVPALWVWSFTPANPSPRSSPSLLRLSANLHIQGDEHPTQVNSDVVSVEIKPDVSSLVNTYGKPIWEALGGLGLTGIVGGLARKWLKNKLGITNV